jgi:hypothetical protein
MIQMGGTIAAVLSGMMVKMLILKSIELGSPHRFKMNSKQNVPVFARCIN